MTITMTVCISSCLTAFGLGYAGGAWIRITRKVFESLD